MHPATPGGADESFDVRVDSKPSQKGASVEPAIPLADRLSFQDIIELLPEHVSKPHPDRVVRDWFNLTMQVSPADSAGRVETKSLFAQWSLAAAPRRAVIEQHFGRYGHAQRGTITEPDFGRLAEEMKFGRIATRLFEELPKLANSRTVRYSTLMINIAAHGASNEMKLFLTATACRSPPEPFELGVRRLRRRVWRPGPLCPAVPSEAAVRRKQLVVAAHGVDKLTLGVPVRELAAHHEDQAWRRYCHNTARENRLAKQSVEELDTLVRRQQRSEPLIVIPRSASGPAHDSWPLHPPSQTPAPSERAHASLLCTHRRTHN